MSPEPKNVHGPKHMMRGISPNLDQATPSDQPSPSLPLPRDTGTLTKVHDSNQGQVSN